MPIQSNVTYQTKNTFRFNKTLITVKTDGYLLAWNFEYKNKSYAACYPADQYSPGEVSTFAKDFIATLVDN